MFNSLDKDSYPYSLNSWATRESFYFTLWTNKSSCPNSPKESPQGWAGVSQVCIQFCHAFFVGGLHGFQIQRSKGHPRLPDVWPCRHRLALGSTIQNSDHITVGKLTCRKCYNKIQTESRVDSSQTCSSEPLTKHEPRSGSYMQV